MAIDHKSTVKIDDKKFSFTVDLRLEQPDIILVEAMDDIDCNCIILNVSQQMDRSNRQHCL